MSHILAKNTPDDDMPDQPKHWQIRMVTDGVNTFPTLYMGCPLGKGLCGVPIKPAPGNANGCSWTWDGDTERPSLSPSINCNGEGGCGWHGHLTKGELIP